MKSPVITISGAALSGKLEIAQVIYQALSEYNIEATITSVDGAIIPYSRDTKRIRNVAKLLDGESISIKLQQERCT